MGKAFPRLSWGIRHSFLDFTWTEGLLRSFLVSKVVTGAQDLPRLLLVSKAFPMFSLCLKFLLRFSLVPKTLPGLYVA